jgi:hypothetical protein
MNLFNCFAVTLQFQWWLHVRLNRQDTCIVIDDGIGARRLQTMVLGFCQIQTMVLFGQI